MSLRAAVLSLRLDQQIEDLALAVDGSLQVHVPALDRDYHLIPVPLLARPGSLQAQVAGVGWAELSTYRLTVS
jgi:hypothetical protein